MKRSTKQNRKLWPLLQEVAAQVTLNGERYDAEEWKIIFLSGLNKTLKLERRDIKGIYGEPVNLGRSSSKLDKDLFSELIELILWYGAKHGVVFRDDIRERSSRMGSDQ
jgi:hypothetical protein